MNPELRFISIKFDIRSWQELPIGADSVIYALKSTSSARGGGENHLLVGTPDGSAPVLRMLWCILPGDTIHPQVQAAQYVGEIACQATGPDRMDRALVFVETQSQALIRETHRSKVVPPRI